MLWGIVRFGMERPGISKSLGLNILLYVLIYVPLSALVQRLMLGAKL
jgi:hypothetical protein